MGHIIVNKEQLLVESTENTSAKPKVKQAQNCSLLRRSWSRLKEKNSLKETSFPCIPYCKQTLTTFVGVTLLMLCNGWFANVIESALSFLPAEDNVDVGIWSENTVQWVTDKEELKQTLLFCSCKMTASLSFQFISCKDLIGFIRAVQPEICMAAPGKT